MLKRVVNICAVQFSCSKNIAANAAKAETFVREAAQKVLLLRLSFIRQNVLLTTGAGRRYNRFARAVSRPILLQGA